MSLNTHYTKLHDDAKQMTYSLERREHDLSISREKATVLESDHKDTITVVMSGLQSDLKNVQMEKDRLQTLWLESQKALVGEQTKYKLLMHENGSLQTKLGISEGVKQKSGNEITAIKEESFEKTQDAAKLYNQLRKLQPVVAELQDRNVFLSY